MKGEGDTRTDVLGPEDRDHQRLYLVIATSAEEAVRRVEERCNCPTLPTFFNMLRRLVSSGQRHDCVIEYWEQFLLHFDKGGN